MPISEQKEEAIEANICEFLMMKGASLDKIISEGFYNANKGYYQRRKSGFTNPGIADIIGVYEGMYFAIEVKKPSEMSFFDNSIEYLTARFTEAQKRGISAATLKKYWHACEQRAFLDDKIRAGGIGFFASSIEEVKQGFKEFNVIL